MCHGNGFGIKINTADEQSLDGKQNAEDFTPKEKSKIKNFGLQSTIPLRRTDRVRKLVLSIVRKGKPKSNATRSNGDGFKTHVQQGDRVKQGQLMIEFDIDFIKKNNLPTITPVLVTNTAAYREVVTVDGKTIKNGEKLISTVV